jgi:hypothetical protein
MELRCLQRFRANATESNWVFNLYEGFSVDRKPLESEMTIRQR